jgi:hypothetical protein
MELTRIEYTDYFLLIIAFISIIIHNKLTIRQRKYSRGFQPVQNAKSPWEYEKHYAFHTLAGDWFIGQTPNGCLSGVSHHCHSQPLHK